MRRKVVAVWVSLLIIVSSIVILVEIAPRVTAPTTLYVGSGGGGNYSKIQWAIDNASDGDTVFVYNGTYYENVVVNKTINLTGEHKDLTIIDGGGSGDVLEITVDWVNVTRFKITNSGNNFGNTGIVLNRVQNCSISNSNVYLKNWRGIYIHRSLNNNIVNNNISSNDFKGIEIASSSMNNIICNNISGITYAIQISASSNNNLYGNNISNSPRGLDLSGSQFNMIISNNFVNSGIKISGVYLYHYNTHIIPNNNSVNGKPLYYYKDQSNFTINGTPVGELILVNCTNIDVKNLHINNSVIGIELAYSTDINIINNTIYSNYIFGIYFEHSMTKNNSIINNVIVNNNYGIRFHYTSQNKITGNNITNNAHGIDFVLYSSKNDVINNNISDNGCGIYIGLSTNNSVINNTISDNSANGVYITTDAFDNIVTQNNILNNNVGINLKYPLNKIYHNNFLFNNIQAYDDTINSNEWDNGYPIGGNYWSDYVGVDYYKGPNQNIPGNDGIGDTNYSIDNDSVDNYPLIDPYSYKSLENYTILKEGWNLISIPLIQQNYQFQKVLEMIDGYYDAVQWFDNKNANDPWIHNKIGKPFGNDLFELNETMSFWIHITQPGDTIFVYNGTQPTSNQTIQLHPGWNMVGYPSLSTHNRTTGLNNLTFDTHVDAIQWYDATAKTWHFMGPDDSFVLGRGYWVHSKVEAEWEVPL